MFREIIRLLRNLDANLLTLLGEVRHTNKLLQAQLDAMHDDDDPDEPIVRWVDEAVEMTPEMWDAATALLIQRKRSQRVRGERL